MKFEKYIIEFLEYLKTNEGFLISEETASSVFVYINENDVDITNEEEIMNVLRSLVCKTKDQYIFFPELFRYFFQLKIKEEKEKEKIKNKKKSIQRKAQKAQENLEKIKRENKENENNNSGISSLFSDDKKKREIFLKKTEKNREKIKKMLNQSKLSKEAKELARCLFFDKKCEKYSNQLLLQLINILQKFIKESAFKAAISGDKELVNTLKLAKDILDEVKNKIEEEKRAASCNQSRESLAQKELDKILKELNEFDSKIIEKENTKQHRESFINAKNSVKNKGKGDLDFDRRISTIKQEDIDNLQYYIKKNARAFKTKISRNIQTDSRLKFDMKNIIKKAFSTDGIPLRLAYKKPIANKPKIVLILDISGSCSSASKLMLLFMYYLKQVFTGGCDAYVFVDSLHNVTNFMNAKDPNEAINAIMSTVPTKGVYSNYYRPLKTFYNERMSTINKDSIIIFIGDARNNSNPTGKEYLKAISRKSRACFWLNTEEKEKWDYKDSIIGIYSKYMQQIEPIVTIGQLINFITNFKIKKGRLQDNG